MGNFLREQENISLSVNFLYCSMLSAKLILNNLHFKKCISSKDLGPKYKKGEICVLSKYLFVSTIQPETGVFFG